MSTSNARPSTSARVQPTFKGIKKEIEKVERTTGKGLDDSLSFADTTLTVMPIFTSYTNLHKLDLTNCGLKEISFIKDCPKLSWLKLEGNAIENWNGLENLSNLFVLNASNCNLTTLPSNLELLYSLKALVITHNKLTSIDHLKQLPNLNSLIVSNNLLTELPASLLTLPSLKKISAAHNLLTCTSFPDLTPLASLKELKLSSNPHLTSLPTHFSSWGKGFLPNVSEKRPKGLEIIDLGNCAFNSWSDLVAIAGQRGVVNLILKGNSIVDEALAEEDGFEGYKNKIKMLLPAVRILDGQRFDKKFFDLKEKRNLRDAAAEEAAIRLVEDEANKKQLELEKVDKALVDKKEKKEKKRKLEEIIPVVEEAAVDVVIKEKRPKRAKREVVVEGQEGELETKKRKNRHDSRREASTGDSTRPAGPSESLPIVSPPSAKKIKLSKVQEIIPPVKKEKRNKKVKEVKEVVVVERKKKDKNGVLSALKGDRVAEAAERAENKLKKSTFIPTGTNAILSKTDEAEVVKEVEKVKTSVVGVVVVKKEGKKLEKKIDLSGFLGLNPAEVSGW